MKPYQQMSFADAEYANKGKVTRREKFLDQLDGLLPWQAMIDVIEPHYAPGNGRGRKPFALESMLRGLFLKAGTIVDASLIAAPTSTRK